MKFLYKAIKNRFNRNSGLALHNFLENKRLCLMDVGAAGGLEPRWQPFIRNLSVVGFEPDDRTSNEIAVDHKDESLLVVNKAVWSSHTNIRIHHTRKPLCSSVYEPNYQYLKQFPDVSRYDIEYTHEYQAVTIAEVCKEHSLEPDFIKLDIQGGELEVLKGLGDAIDTIMGLEVEVEFKPFYVDQPLYPDILQHLQRHDFSMIDFVGLGRMERTGFRGIGECNFGDLLFLRTPEYILERYRANVIESDSLLKYCAILHIYHRYDLLLTIHEALDDHGHEQNIKQKMAGILADARRKTAIICAISKYSSYLINLFGVSNRVNVLY